MTNPTLPKDVAATMLRLLQASSCFFGEVCACPPCACAESLALASQSQERDAEIRRAAIEEATHND